MCGSPTCVGLLCLSWCMFVCVCGNVCFCVCLLFMARSVCVLCVVCWICCQMLMLKDSLAYTQPCTSLFLLLSVASAFQVRHGGVGAQTEDSVPR